MDEVDLIVYVYLRFRMMGITDRRTWRIINLCWHKSTASRNNWESLSTDAFK